MTEPSLDELDDFVLWRTKNPGLTLLEYAYHNLSTSMAIAVTRLFWPELVMHKGGVFLADSFSEAVFDAWNSKLGGNMRAIEQIMNHAHLVDMARSFRALGVQSQKYLIDVISNCWRGRLKQAYPDLNFCIQVEPEADGLDNVITFWQND